MPIICPTITASSEQYESYIIDYCKFAKRIHIDLSDGIFSPNKTLALSEIYWPYNVLADLHLMYQDPVQYIDEIISLKPNLVIVHAEVDMNIQSFAKAMKENDIKVGLALLAETPVTTIAPVIEFIDHVLVFSGKLGFYGGVANLELTGKVKQLKELKPELEIAWDGGINPDTQKSIIEAGVDVLDVGGYIAGSENSREAYDKLVEGIA